MTPSPDHRPASVEMQDLEGSAMRQFRGLIGRWLWKLAALQRSLSWPMIGAVMVPTAFAGFLYLDGFPQARGGMANEAFLFLWIVLAAVPLGLVAAMTANRETIAATSAHAALFTVMTIVLVVTSRNDPFASLIMAVQVAILAVELLLLLVALCRAEDRHPTLYRLYPTLTLALLGGLFFGALAWSGTVPARILGAADAFAKGRPYCLMRQGRRVDDAATLTGLSLQSRWFWPTNDFYLVMVIGDGTLANWSFRRNGFQSLGTTEAESQRDARTCPPITDFSVNLQTG